MGDLFDGEGVEYRDLTSLWIGKNTLDAKALLQEQKALLREQERRARGVCPCPHCGGGIPAVGVSACMHCTRPLFWNNGFVAGTQEAANRAAAAQREQAAQAAQAAAARQEREKARQEEWVRSSDASFTGGIAVALGGFLLWVAWKCVGLNLFLNVLAAAIGVVGGLICFAGLAILTEFTVKTGKDASKKSRERGNQAPPPGSSGAYR